MFISQKPSSPSVDNKNISVDVVPNAVQYVLYRVRYALDTNFLCLDGSLLMMRDGSIFETTARNTLAKAFKLADGCSLNTSTGQIFASKDAPDDGYQSSYTGAQLDAVVRRILG